MQSRCCGYARFSIDRRIGARARYGPRGSGYQELRRAGHVRIDGFGGGGICAAAVAIGVDDSACTAVDTLSGRTSAPDAYMLAGDPSTRVGVKIDSVPKSTPVEPLAARTTAATICPPRCRPRSNRHGGFALAAPTCEYSPSFWMNAEPGSDGLAPVKGSHTPHSALLALPSRASTARPCSKGVRDAIHGLGKPATRLRRAPCSEKHMRGYSRVWVDYIPVTAGTRPSRAAVLSQEFSVFPRCACARRAMTAWRGRFLRWDGPKALALRFGMTFAGYPSMDSAGRGERPYKPRSRSSGCCTGSCVFSCSDSASGPRFSLRSLANS